MAEAMEVSDANSHRLDQIGVKSKRSKDKIPFAGLMSHVARSLELESVRPGLHKVLFAVSTASRHNRSTHAKALVSG